MDIGKITISVPPILAPDMAWRGSTANQAPPRANPFLIDNREVMNLPVHGESSSKISRHLREASTQQQLLTSKLAIRAAPALHLVSLLPFAHISNAKRSLFPLLNFLQSKQLELLPSLSFSILCCSPSNSSTRACAPAGVHGGGATLPVRGRSVG